MGKKYAYLVRFYPTRSIQKKILKDGLNDLLAPFGARISDLSKKTNLIECSNRPKIEIIAK